METKRVFGKQLGQKMKMMKYNNVLVRLSLFLCVIFLNSNCAITAEGNNPAPYGLKVSARGGKSYAFTLMHDGQAREYEVYLPHSYSADGPKLPLVLYIHGAGGKIKSAYLDGLDEAADQFGFVLAVPLATDVKGGFLGTRWNGGKWEGGSCCGKADDIGFISKMIDEVVGKYRINEKRIYATGISNGGLMVNRIACELAHKVAAVSTVAPTAIPEPCLPTRPISVMNIHGTGDPANPFDGGEVGRGFKVDYRKMPPLEVVAKWVEINGCSNSGKVSYQNGAATCTSYPCNGESELVFCKVEEMGHVYPSGSQYFFKAVVGPVSYDIGHQQVWDFFMKHSLQ